MFCQAPHISESFQSHARPTNVKVTGLVQKLGQLEAVNREFHSKYGANLQLLGQPYNFHATAGEFAVQAKCGVQASEPDRRGKPQALTYMWAEKCARAKLLWDVADAVGYLLEVMKSDASHDSL